MSGAEIRRSWVCTSPVQTLVKSHRDLLWASSKFNKSEIKPKLGFSGSQQTQAFVSNKIHKIWTN